MGAGPSRRLHHCRRVGARRAARREMRNLRRCHRVVEREWEPRTAPPPWIAEVQRGVGQAVDGQGDAPHLAGGHVTGWHRRQRRVADGCEGAAERDGSGERDPEPVTERVAPPVALAAGGVTEVVTTGASDRRSR